MIAPVSILKKSNSRLSPTDDSSSSDCSISIEFSSLDDASSSSDSHCLLAVDHKSISFAADTKPPMIISQRSHKSESNSEQLLASNMEASAAKLRGPSQQKQSEMHHSSAECDRQWTRWF
ncbi:hypothetical protein MPSEU_000762100 [Mayamaea pseudoterrestris]|nr:hypothetical protein MPSEU_000762100 [Mayamaea pseudoterrestris]